MTDHYSFRGKIIQIILGVALLIIVAQLFNLQVISSKYSQMADNQAIYRKVIYPTRGVVFDRKKKILVDNTTLYDLVIIPAQVRESDTTLVKSILKIDAEEFHNRLIGAIIKNGRYQPSVFEGLLDDKTYAALAENHYRIQPGFDLVERPVRKYPYPVAGHVFGYLGEVDPGFLERHASEGYRMGDYTGMTGLESSYEKVLMGVRGIEYWQRDNKNRPTKRWENGDFDTTAIPGKALYSSMDADLQAIGEKLMAGKMGSVVAIDPKTGGILAMVSAPGYDPNLLTGAQRRREFSRMYVDPRQPLLNRAITGSYSPGSTFKTLQALVAMQEGVIDQNYGYPCRGGYFGCGRRMGCHGGGHANNLQEAIAVSCNAYFADVFRKIVDNPKYPNVDSGLAVWDNYMYAFGLGHRLGVDIPAEKGGNIPTPKYYRKIFGQNWHSCNIVSVSIGQGEVNSTVLQLTNAIAMIANRGWYYTPHFIDSIEGGDVYDILEPYRIRNEPIHIPDEMFEAVHQGMYNVVQGPGGTGRRVAIEGIEMCGKTGTVENSYKGSKQKDHSFFAAFAPAHDPQIAIACIVENGGFGATVAAPVVSLMIEQYLTDTISKKRQAWVEQYSNMEITPQRIKDAIIVRDSINRAKDSVRARKQLLKKIKEETGIDENPDSNKVELRQRVGQARPEKGNNSKQALGVKVAAVLPSGFQQRNWKKIQPIFA